MRIATLASNLVHSRLSFFGITLALIFTLLGFFFNAARTVRQAAARTQDL